MKRTLLFFLVFAFIFATPLFAQSAWPRTISMADGGKLTIYEPQPESFSGRQLSARAAVSVRKSGSDEPTFGVIFFDATLNGNSTNEIASMRIKQAKFSGMEDQQLVDNYSALIEKNIPGSDLGMSDSQISEAVEHEAAAGFNNDAPNIIYKSSPSTLILLDGEPKISHDKNIDADKVVNSPNLIFKDGNQWNLYAGGNWYRSTSITSGWTINNNLSAKVKKVNEAVKKQEKENNKGEDINTAPRKTDIIVATEPTELLQTDGEPQYKTVAGTSLLYVANSPNEIFKDVNSQKSYILIAGRWYSASDMNGTWKYVPSDKLPDDFAQIPVGSDKDRVLSSVAGTEAAEDARVNAAMPQTAKVDKRTATVDVEYDGTPVFNPIEGTSLELAENANVTVMIDASGRYFALDNGVWFVGQSAYGPWKVANERPRDVDDIPASSPAYNSRYVYIYDDYPDYVYMGYTPGYLGSYYYGPTVVYGTGWHYRPWYHRVYYPRPVTWGFGFMYDPWIGWNINWGFNWGYLYVGFNYGYPAYGYAYGGGWFGPHYYCPPYRRHYYGGYYGRHDYYGYNSYRYRNGYGYRDNYGYRNNGTGSRPDRRAGVVNQPNRNPNSGWSRNYNLYSNQRGATSQPVVRTTRVYRPGLQSTVNANGSNNRLTPITRNNRIFENNFDNSVTEQPSTPRSTNGRQPVITNPGRSDQGSRNNSPFERPGRRNESAQPQQRETPQVNRPSTESRRIENGRTTRQLPEAGNQPERRREPVQQQERRLEPVERPQQGRRLEPVERPQQERRLEPVQREQPQRNFEPIRRQQERPSQAERSAPVERPQRSYSPPQRMERSSAAPRVERPSGNSNSSPSHGGLQRGRPDRR